MVDNTIDNRITEIEKVKAEVKEKLHKTYTEERSEAEKLSSEYDKIIEKEKEEGTYKDYIDAYNNKQEEFLILEERYNLIIQNIKLEINSLENKLSTLYKEKSQNPECIETRLKLQKILDKLIKFKDKIYKDGDLFNLITSRDYKKTIKEPCTVYVNNSISKNTFYIEVEIGEVYKGCGEYLHEIEITFSKIDNIIDIDTDKISSDIDEIIKDIIELVSLPYHRLLEISKIVSVE